MFNLLKRFMRKKTIKRTPVTELELKQLLYDRARILGCDWDGDVIVFNGIHYYINIQCDIVERIIKVKERRSRD